MNRLSRPDANLLVAGLCQKFGNAKEHLITWKPAMLRFSELARMAFR